MQTTRPATAAKCRQCRHGWYPLCLNARLALSPASVSLPTKAQFHELLLPASGAILGAAAGYLRKSQERPERLAHFCRGTPSDHSFCGVATNQDIELVREGHHRLNPVEAFLQRGIDDTTRSAATEPVLFVEKPRETHSASLVCYATQMHRSAVENKRTTKHRNKKQTNNPTHTHTHTRAHTHKRTFTHLLCMYICESG